MHMWGIFLYFFRYQLMPCLGKFEFKLSQLRYMYVAKTAKGGQL